MRITTSGQATSSGGAPTLTDLSALVNGSTTVFAVPAHSLGILNYNGVEQSSGASNDYVDGGTSLTMAVAPESGSKLTFLYWT